MRYYADAQLPTNWSWKMTDILVNSTLEKRILTHEGLYKYVGNKLHKYKLCLADLSDESSESHKIKSSIMKWVKYDTVYNIPTKHKILDIRINIYKLHPKSTTTFVVEEFNNSVNDYYFKSVEDIDNYSLLEDIDSFLSLLK